MGWTSNDLRIEMMNNEAAKNAAEAIKNFATANAANYDTLNMDNFMSDLTVEGNSVVLDGSYAMHGWDYMNFVPEICKMIAATESFEGNAEYCSGYGDEGNFEFSCENGVLKMRSVSYPNGYCSHLCCEECGMDVVAIDEYEAGKIYICPECGEEIDLSEAFEEYSPVIAEEEFCIK